MAVIRNELFGGDGSSISADIIDLDASTFTHEDYGVVTEGPRALTEAEIMAYDPPPADGEMLVDKWVIVADGQDQATITVGTGSDATAYFVVDGQVSASPCVRGRATLAVTVAAPGAVVVRWRDRTAVIVGS